MTPEAATKFYTHFFTPESFSQSNSKSYARDCVFQGSILGIDKNDSDMSVLVVIAREKYAFERDIAKLIPDEYLVGKAVKKSVAMTDASQPDSRHIYDVVVLRSANTESLQKIQKEIGNFQAVAKDAEPTR